MRKFKRIMSCVMIASVLLGSVVPAQQSMAVSKTKVTTEAKAGATTEGKTESGATTEINTGEATGTTTEVAGTTIETPTGSTTEVTGTTTETPTGSTTEVAGTMTETPTGSTTEVAGTTTEVAGTTTETPTGSTSEVVGTTTETPTGTTTGAAGTTTETTAQAPNTTTPLPGDYIVSQLSPFTSKVIVLDPGHCATHPGAQGYGLREEVVVLDITNACRKALQEYGDVTVYMTRETGECCVNLDLGGCLTARNNYAKMLEADFLVSMHINAGRTTGANVLTAYKSGYNDEIRIETQAFGRLALKKLKALGVANRGLLLRKSESNNRYKNGKLADYYSIVRNGVVQQIPSVIIEHGYISSASDCSKFFKTSEMRRKLGKADAEAIVEYYGLSQPVIKGKFKVINGDTYYVTGDGKKVTGWVKDDEKWYYFAPDSAKLQKGFMTFGEELVYLSPLTGEAVTGWFVVNNEKYLAQGNGAVVRGTTHSDGRYRYLFHSDGRMLKKGFHTLEDGTYYVDKYKHVVTGVQKINGKYYGFDADTCQQMYGEQKISGKYYYFDEATGAAKVKKIVKIDGKRYYFGSKGARQTGWVTYKGNRYYFHPKNGAMMTGWRKINNRYYYFNKSSGKMQRNKWIGKYYVNGQGVRSKKR